MLCLQGACTRSGKRSLTLFVFSSSGGIGKAATVVHLCLANILSDKWISPHSLIMSWLHCSLGFSLLHSLLTYLCRSHLGSGSQGVSAAVDLVVEGHLATSSD